MTSSGTPRPRAALDPSAADPVIIGRTAVPHRKRGLVLALAMTLSLLMPALGGAPAFASAGPAVVRSGVSAADPALARSGVSAAVTTALAPQPAGWPRFAYQGIITDKARMKYNPTNEYIFPSVFHAGAHLADPLGEWYLYLAPHDAPGGIVLMVADSLDGPWTEYGANPIISKTWSGHYSVNHVSSPDAIWNEAAGRVFLYFHGDNTVTRYATSSDGIAFSYGGVAVTNAMGGPNVVETSYARVFEHPDPASPYKYGMFYMANERDNVRRIRLAESVDGRRWTVSPTYVVAPGPEEGLNVSAGNLWERDGKLYVVYHGSSGRIYARTIDRTLRNVGTTPILLHASSGVGADTGRVGSPEIVSDGGVSYLFYESGERLGATIAWAKESAQPMTSTAAFPTDARNPVFQQCAAPGTDEFEGSALAPGVWDRVLRRPSSSRAVVGDRLILATVSGGIATAPLLQQELPSGPWEVTTKVTIDARQSFQQAGLLLYRSDTQYAKLDLGYASTGPTVEFVFAKNGSNRQDASAPRVAGVKTVWLRLTSDGTDIRAGGSYDGVTFGSYGRPISVADGGFTHIGPYAIRGTASAPEIQAGFDWFRFSPTTDAYAACPSRPMN